MRNRRWTWILPLMLLLWAGFVYLNSYVRNPPFRIIPREFFFALLTGECAFPVDLAILKAVLEASCSVMLCAFIGGLFLRRLGAGYPRHVFWTAALGIGIALVAVPLEFLGIFFVLSRWTIAGALLLTALAAALPWARWVGAPGTVEGPEIPKENTVARTLGGIAAVLIAFISFFTFYHAVLFPVVYWDSLIYYVGYAKQTFEAGGFPIHVTAQVGLGIGANYPHLYDLLQNVPAFLFGEWSNVYGQFLPPLLGVLATVLVYQLLMEVWGNRLLALLGALLFRAVPYGICYFINASDYSLAIFFVALFLYLAYGFYRDPCASRLLLLGLTASAAAKVNYLMPFLSVFFVVIGLRWLLKRGNPFRRRGFAVVVICLVLASTWYVRNWIVAGNPIYPYFPEILGGKNIDLEVLCSCETEWIRHGDGIGRFGSTLGRKIEAIPRFFMTEPNYHWKLWPIFVGFWVPGLLLFIYGRIRRRRNGDNGNGKAATSLLWLSTAIVGFILVYHFGISSFYYYHMTPFLPGLVPLACLPLRRVLRSSFGHVAAVLVLFSGIVPGLAMSIMGPKIMAPSLHHLAEPYPENLFDNPASWIQLGSDRINAIRHQSSTEVISVTLSIDRLPKGFLDRRKSAKGVPLVMSPIVSKNSDAFLYLKFGGDYLMFAWLGDLLPDGAKVLTHENRHLYLPNKVKIVHLDDWDISQNYYGAKWEDFRKYLIENGIRYYLKVPYENDHPILKRLGLDDTLKSDWRKIAEWETMKGGRDTIEEGRCVLYELRDD